MSEPSSSRSPSPAPKIEKKLKKKRKSIVEDAPEPTVDATNDEDAAAAAKAEKKLKKKSSKKALKEAAIADVEAMAVDEETDVKAEKKSKKKSKKAATVEEEDKEVAEDAMEVDESAEASTKSAESKSDKKLKRKRKEEAAEEASKEAESGDEDAADAEPAEDEPVLSHAERRRRKKEAKLAAKLKAAAGEDSDSDDDDAKDGAKATKKRKLKDGSAKTVAANAATRKNSVWVGNMSFKTQPENLKTFFEGVGEITRINMPTKAPAGPGMRPENRGFAYVDFATPEAKQIAIALSENPLLGRKLLIKDGDDFAGRPAAISAEHAITDPALAHKTHSKTAQKILRAQKQPPAPTLFFGNLPFETTEDTIRELLEAHRSYAVKKSKDEDGKDKDKDEKPKEVWIRKVRMGTFEDTGACKGFAFVDFMTTEHATSALINPRNHHLNGRKLVVEYASAEAVRRGAPKGKGDGVFKGSRAARPERTWGARKPGAHDHDQEHDHEHGAGAGAGAEGAESGAGGDADAGAAADGDDAAAKKSWEHKEPQLNSQGRHKGPRSRPKPGAALAQAKRESIAIVPSQGQKITF